VKLHGRIQVEPLDDERLTNIERQVVASASVGQPVPARRYPVLIAAAVAACAAGAIGWKLRPTESAVEPDEPAHIAVHTDGKGQTLDIGDATIASAADTAFVVSRPAGGVLIEMTRGKVELAVGKRGARPPLVVRAGSTNVVVVGTRFSVDYGDGTKDVDVRVTEGAVRVVDKQLETRVGAGQHWHTDRGLVVAVAETPRPPAPPDAPISVPADVHLHDRTPAAPEAPKHVEPSRPVVVEARPVRPRIAVAEPHRDLKAEIISQPIEPAMDIGVKDVNEAMSRLRVLVLGEKNEGAATALYSMAVLQHQKLGRDGDALRSIDAYARAYPFGKEIRAALWLRVRILCRIAIDDQCRQAAVQYQRKGDGPAAHVAERITAP
jgi:hypothetical protein